MKIVKMSQIGKGNREFLNVRSNVEDWCSKEETIFRDFKGGFHWFGLLMTFLNKYLVYQMLFFKSSLDRLVKWSFESLHNLFLQGI